MLTDDGTCWVNLGDSYYNYQAKEKDKDYQDKVSQTKQDLPDECVLKRGNKLEGLKEKDLIGIPWQFCLRNEK